MRPGLLLLLPLIGCDRLLMGADALMWKNCPAEAAPDAEPAPFDWDCDTYVTYPRDSPAFDCDDGDPEVHPAASEECDGIDNNCDGSVDADGSVPYAWLPDADGDGAVSDALLESVGVTGCLCPYDNLVYANLDHCPGYVWVDLDPDRNGEVELQEVLLANAGLATDCDDGDAGVHPGAPEYCDGVDNNCDGSIDEGEAVDALTWWPDADGDGYAPVPDDPDAVAVLACAPPAGFAPAEGPADCDDTDPTVSPGAIDYCGNGVDDDCDGLPDECSTPLNDPASLGAWWVDEPARKPTLGCDWHTWSAVPVGDGSAAFAVGFPSVDPDCPDDHEFESRQFSGMVNLYLLAGDPTEPMSPGVGLVGNQKGMDFGTVLAAPGAVFSEGGSSLLVLQQRRSRDGAAGDVLDDPGPVRMPSVDTGGIADTGTVDSGGADSGSADSGGADSGGTGGFDSGGFGGGSDSGFFGGGEDEDEDEDQPDGAVYLFSSLDDVVDGSAEVVEASDAAAAVFTGVIVPRTPDDATTQMLDAAGDVDGDGYMDFLIGSPLHGGQAPDEEYGYAWLLFGQETAPVATQKICKLQAIDRDTDPALADGDIEGWCELVTGEQASPWRVVGFRGGAGERLGTTVAGVGDLNGDGLGEVAVANGTGLVFVVYGMTDLDRPQPFDGTDRDMPWFVLEDVTGGASGQGPEEYVQAQAPCATSSIDALGDVDGDGYGEAAIGSACMSMTTVIPGGIGRCDTLQLDRGSDCLGRAMPLLVSPEPNDGAGFSVAGVGDLDGDDRSELVVGAPYASELEDGAAYLYMGGAWLDATQVDPTSRFVGGSYGRNAGVFVGGGGPATWDPDHDNLTDLLIGGGELARSPLDDTGIVWVLPGSTLLDMW